MEGFKGVKMRKKFVYILSLCVLMFSLTGCVKFNATMDISVTKSMDFSIIYAVDTSIFGDQELLSSEEKDNALKSGFTVTDYEDESMKGVVFSKTVKNIDSISSSDDVEYSLSGILEESNQDVYVFKVQKGFFKNVYTANFIFDSSDSDLNMTGDDSDYDIDYSDNYDIEYEDDLIYDVTDDFEYTESEDDFDFSELTDSMSNLDMSFNVNLPFSALSNNASITNNGNKQLTWNLTTSGEDSIQFEFALYNLVNIGIVAGALLLIIILLIIILSGKKKKTSTTKTIDPSVGVPEITNLTGSNQSESVIPDFDLNSQNASSEAGNVNFQGSSQFVNNDINVIEQPQSFTVFEQPIIDPISNEQPVQSINLSNEQPVQSVNSAVNNPSNIFEQPIIDPVQSDVEQIDIVTDDSESNSNQNNIN